MKYVGALTRLMEHLGDERFQALVDSTNTERVKELCDDLLKSPPPAIMTLGRTYEILSFLKDGEGVVESAVMVERVKELGIDFGKEDCEYLIAHQAEIPIAFRGKINFIFPNWRNPSLSDYVALVRWNDSCWVLVWPRLVSDWSDRTRLLRRKP